MVTRIGSFSQSQALLLELTRQNAKVFKSQEQVATGKVADNFKDIAADAGVLLTAKKVEARTQQFQNNIIELSTRVEVQNIQLTRIEGVAAELRQDLLDAISLESGAALTEKINSAFQQVLNTLNAQYDDRYIFGGTQSDRPPVNIASIADLVAIPAVSDVFDNNQLRQAVPIDEGQNITIGFLADQLGTDILQVLKDLATFDAGGSGPFGEQLTAAQRSFLESQIAPLSSAHEQLISRTSENGLLANQLDSARDRHESSIISLKQFISDIEDVDLAEAVTRLNQDQIAVQASARILADLGDLTLLNFL